MKNPPITQEFLQQKALNAWHNAGCRGTLAMATGTGKSKVAIMAMKGEKDRSANHSPDFHVLVVEPTEQMRDVDFPAEMQKWGYTDKDKVDIICYASLHKYQIEHYDLVILDEVHHLTEYSAMFFLNDDGRCKVLGLSATPPKYENCTDTEIKKCNILDHLGLSTVFEYSITQAKADGISSDFEVWVIQQPLDDTIRYINAGTKAKPFKTTEAKAYEYLRKGLLKAQSIDVYPEPLMEPVMGDSGDFSPDQYVALMAAYDTEVAKHEKSTLSRDFQIRRWTTKRTDLIYHSYSKRLLAGYILQVLLQKNRSVILFFKRKSEAEALCGKRVYHSTSGTEALDQFRRGEISYIGVVDALNEGVNIPKADVALVVQTDASDRSLMQRIGRVVRKTSETKKAFIYILCLTGTQDEVWAAKALSTISYNTKPWLMSAYDTLRLSRQLENQRLGDNWKPETGSINTDKT